MKLIFAAHCILTVSSFAAALPPCHAAKGALSVTFRDPLNPAGVKPDAFALTVWSFKRSADYGSNHCDGHPPDLTGARIERSLHGTIHQFANP
jgi:hypothetical protein